MAVLSALSAQVSSAFRCSGDRESIGGRFFGRSLGNFPKKCDFFDHPIAGRIYNPMFERICLERNTSLEELH
jgi:hypothetical protein